MLLLFVGGVMNLYVIAALSTVVAVEKTSRLGELGSRVSGGVLSRSHLDTSRLARLWS